MSDEFPALEAAAALGVLVLSVRAFLISKQGASIRRDNEKIVIALKDGAHSRAVELCARAESPAYSDIARRILSVVEERGRKLSGVRFDERIVHAASTGLARASRRLATGRARDLIALAVLFGALAYGTRGALEASSWFLPLVAAACGVVMVSFVLRGRVSRELQNAVSTLIVAATSSAATAPDALSDGPCNVCGEAEQIVLRGPQALDRAPAIAIEELRICRNCGQLHGRAKEPREIPIGPSHGTALAVTLDPAALEIASNPREHEG